MNKLKISKGEGDPPITAPAQIGHNPQLLLPDVEGFNLPFPIHSGYFLRWILPKHSEK